ncbi:PIN domain-containing protein [Paraburkholderia sp. SIMBA_050]
MPRTHLFIDTNVFLDFYSYSKEALSLLKTLREHMSEDGIWLHLPRQVANELERNRESKLKTAADTFMATSHPANIPEHMADYPEIADYKDAINRASNLRTVIVNRAASEAASRTLSADVVLNELFQCAKQHPVDDQIFATACKRAQQGNPPGKPDSIGDQFNWETLLAVVPKEDLHIVSKDGDYISKMNPGRAHPFLAQEWKEKKEAELHVYKSIKPFLDRYLTGLAETAANQPPEPPQELPVLAGDMGIVAADAVANAAGTVTAPDPQKAAAIEALVSSESFASTHEAIASLEQFVSALSPAEVERLLTAAIDNTQIRWIASDSDVYAFYITLLVDHLNDVDAGLHDAAAEIFVAADTEVS